MQQWSILVVLVILLNMVSVQPGWTQGDVGSPVCRDVQLAVQGAVGNETNPPYRNHGQYVSAAAQAANPALEAGEITEACHECIVSQFARSIPISNQEACGTDFLCPGGVCTGYIHVTNTATSADMGFVSNQWNVFGEYGITMNTADRLLVTFSESARFSITAVNGPNSSFPYVGGIVGFGSTSDDLSPGSYNYAYLGGTVQTPVNSPPISGGNSFTTATGRSRNIESAIWSISASNVLTAQWVNTNSAEPATYIMFYSPDNVLVLTGDPAVFSSVFAPSLVVTLTFVPQ